MNNLILQYSYSFLHILSNFTLPLLIILLGIKGNFSLVADVSILQSILFMLFFPFTGNSRNYILNTKDNDLVKNILNFRSLIYIPLFLVSFLFASAVININNLTLSLLVLVGTFFWFLEIFITQCEKQKSYKIIFLLIFLKISALIYLLLSDLNENSINLYCIFLITFNSPIILIIFLKNLFNIHYNKLKDIFLKKILTQIGGTVVIGLSSFIIKFSLILILPKTVAGTIFLSYTIGASICTTLTYSFMPSVIYNNFIQMKKAFISSCLFFCLIGTSVLVIKFFNISIIKEHQDLFLICMLFSLGGSLISIFSQYYKFYVSYKITDLNLTMYELIINLTTVMTVILLVLFLNEYGAVLTYPLSGLISLYIYKNIYLELNNKTK